MLLSHRMLLTLGGCTISQSIFKFKLTFFMRLAGAKIMTDELKLMTVATESSVNIPLVPRYLVHLGLCQCAVVVILAVGAAAATGFSLIDLHSYTQGNPVFRVSALLVAGVFRAKHPVLDDHRCVLLVLSGSDEWFAFAHTREAFNHNHWLFHCVTSLPEARMLIADAVPAIVEMNPDAGRTCPTNSGNV